MLKLLTTLALSIFATSATAEIKQKTSIDLGLQFAPSACPELGYSRTQTKFGFDLGISFFENQGVSFNSYPTKFLRFGLGQINNQFVFTMAPFSAILHKQLYLTPSFGFGKSPYTLIGLTYTIFD